MSTKKTDAISQERKANKTAKIATLDDVAAAAGVSASTVSRILNGTARVSDAKVREVNAAITKLQYVPNPAARLLARGRSMNVGVVTQSLNSPYYGEAALAIESVLLSLDYSPLFVSGHWRLQDQRKCINRLLAQKVEGIILITSSMPEDELIQLAKSVPLVLTGRLIDSPNIYCLDNDNTPAARLATEYLIGQGHRHIAFIAGPSTHPDAIQRLQGLKSALTVNKIAFSKQLVSTGDYTEAGGYEAMNRLIDSKVKFTAVFAANDEMAFGAMLALYRRGIKVPQDVSIIGFDDLHASSFTIPPLTSLHRSIDEVGDHAARAMIDLIEGRTPVAWTPSVRLSIRESTQPNRELTA